MRDSRKKEVTFCDDIEVQLSTDSTGASSTVALFPFSRGRIANMEHEDCEERDPAESKRNHDNDYVEKTDAFEDSRYRLRKKKGILKNKKKSKRKRSSSTGISSKERVNDSKIQVQVRNAGNGDSENSFITSPKTRRIVLSILLYSILITAASGWLLRQFFRIPGLNDEIRDLSNQISKLSKEVDRFSYENGRLEKEVDRLTDINNDLEQTASHLNEENNRLEGFASQLNATLDEFKEQNILLLDENARYEEYTRTLNETVDDLVTELVDVRNTEKQLENAIDDYELVARTLRAEISILGNHTDELNKTVQELDSAIDVFEEENQQFRELNEDLRKIVSFLEVEANDVQTSYEELAQQLADTILRKEVLAEIGLQERMKSELSGWECGFLTAFGDKDFGKDPQVAIGYSSYDTVMNYISDRLLSDVCIVRGNLELFLRSEIVPDGTELWDITMKDLAFGVNIYSAKVLNHYFPGENDTEGLENSTWNAADYECSNLDVGDRYSYVASQ